MTVEEGAQGSPPARDPRHHRADRNAQQLGAFRVGQLFERDQQQGFALLDRKPRQRCQQVHAQARVRVGAALGIGPVLPLFGTLAASLAYLCPLLLSVVVCVALCAPPLARTPAARRCLRRPPVRARAPRVLRTLENPR